MPNPPQGHREACIVGGVMIALVIFLIGLYMLVPALPVGTGNLGGSQEILRYLFGRSSM